MDPQVEAALKALFEDSDLDLFNTLIGGMTVEQIKQVMALGKIIAGPLPQPEPTPHQWAPQIFEPNPQLFPSKPITPSRGGWVPPRRRQDNQQRWAPGAAGLTLASAGSIPTGDA